eukprot:s2508_g7.t1
MLLVPFLLKPYLNFKPSVTLALLPIMPQRCHGLEDPAGGSPRPCIFAADGCGKASALHHQRDGQRCPFCCPEAFDRANSSRLGKRNITNRLKAWQADKNPVYEAAFTFGIPRLLLSFDAQQQLRRRAGELPRFQKKISWAHKTKTRLQALRHGKPIPAAPTLSEAGHRFLCQCRRRFDQRCLDEGDFWLPWVQELRFQVRKYDKYRRAEPGASVIWRRAWWKLRRELRKRLQPAVAKGKPFAAAIEWAAAEGIIVGISC